jgi:hypothetical protein
MSEVSTEETAAPAAEGGDGKSQGSNTVPMSRFNEIYAKSKANERALNDTQSIINEMRRHNEMLTSKMDAMGEKVNKTVETKNSTTIAELAKKKFIALDTGDYDAAVVYDEQINALRNEKLFTKMSSAAQKATVQPQTAPVSRAAQDDAAVDKMFAEENSWYNPVSPDYNEDMADFARIKDSKLRKANPAMPVKDRLNKVAQETSKLFSSKTDPVLEGQSMVEGGGSSYPQATKVTKLTPEQRRVAVLFNPELDPKKAEEVYIKNLNR